MKYLDYYFVKEFQWHKKWFSEDGLLKPIIRPTDSFIKNKGWVDFEILEYVFIYNSKMTQIDFVAEIIRKINLVLEKHLENFSIYNEIVELEILYDFCRPIDNIGGRKNEEGPLSWNIKTKQSLQYIPTTEFLNILNEWLLFLSVSKSVSIIT